MEYIFIALSNNLWHGLGSSRVLVKSGWGTDISGTFPNNSRIHCWGGGGYGVVFLSEELLLKSILFQKDMNRIASKKNKNFLSSDDREIVS